MSGIKIGTESRRTPPLKRYTISEEDLSRVRKRVVANRESRVVKKSSLTKGLKLNPKTTRRCIVEVSIDNMENVKLNVVEDKTKKKKTLVISIELNVKGKPSKSGKSIVFGSTKGNITVPGTLKDPKNPRTGLKLGLNCYRLLEDD